MRDLPAIWRAERLLMNAGEPDNRAEVYFRDSGDPDALELVGLVFDGRFRHDRCRCGLWRLRDGGTVWWSDTNQGQAPTLRTAWEKLPSLVTAPEREHEGDAERLAMPIRCLAAQRGRAMLAPA